MSNDPAFASATDAAKTARAALGFLPAVDPTRLVAGEQAQCLQILEQVTSMGTAARASVLGAFIAGQGYAADADYSPRPRTSLTGRFASNPCRAGRNSSRRRVGDLISYQNDGKYSTADSR